MNDYQKKIALQCIEWIEQSPVGFEAIPFGEQETCSTPQQCNKFFAEVNDLKKELAI